MQEPAEEAGHSPGQVGEPAPDLDQPVESDDEPPELCSDDSSDEDDEYVRPIRTSEMHKRNYQRRVLGLPELVYLRYERERAQEDARRALHRRMTARSPLLKVKHRRMKVTPEGNTAEDTLPLDSGATSPMLGIDVAERLQPQMAVAASTTVVQTGRADQTIAPVGRADVGGLKNSLLMQEDELTDHVASVPQYDLEG